MSLADLGLRLPLPQQSPALRARGLHHRRHRRHRPGLAIRRHRRHRPGLAIRRAASRLGLVLVSRNPYELAPSPRRSGSSTPRPRSACSSSTSPANGLGYRCASDFGRLPQLPSTTIHSDRLLEEVTEVIDMDAGGYPCITLSWVVRMQLRIHRPLEEGLLQLSGQFPTQDSSVRLSSAGLLQFAGQFPTKVMCEGDQIMPKCERSTMRQLHIEFAVAEEH